MKNKAIELERSWSEVADEYFRIEYMGKNKYPALPLRQKYIISMLDGEQGPVLDIGCGPGEMMIELLRTGYTVYGIDISENMLNIARENIEKKGTIGEFYLSKGNIESLDFEDNFFDTVICAGVLEYLGKDDFALKELYRVLKDNGTLIISVRNKLCPFRIFDLLLDSIKMNSSCNALLKWVRKKISKKVTSDIFIPYRKHVPMVLDKRLESLGFKKRDSRYFHFYPFFSHLEHIFPSFFINTGLRMERLSRTRLGWMGSGYIVKVQKVART